LPARDLERNKEIAVTRRKALVRAYKRLYGPARTRIMGLNKNLKFYVLAAMAGNICKGAKFLTLYWCSKICTRR